jgi:glycosyltransferase involved in cell wall biosynthesis
MGERVRVAAVMSHPTQYHAPWFRQLGEHEGVDLTVLYCLRPTNEQQGTDFGVAFEWDLPLLDGYHYKFLRNRSRRPGFHFLGCDTPELATELDPCRYDVVLINGWNVRSYWQAASACVSSGLPMLIRGDSHLLDHRPVWVDLLKRMVLKPWLAKFDAFLPVGKLNAEYYDRFGGRRDRYFPVRHFVDNDWFDELSGNARARLPEIRQRFDVPPARTTFLFAGKFVAKKRPMDLMVAFERVCKETTDAHLLMVGDGELRSACRSFAEERKLPVTFTGFLNQREIPDAYACADALILPSSHQETWGLVVNEAMACGLPAIVSDKVGCGPDLVSSSRTGDVFPAGDSRALAEIMIAYVRDRHATAAKGIAAKNQMHRYTCVGGTTRTVEAIRYVHEHRRHGGRRAPDALRRGTQPDTLAVEQQPQVWQRFRNSGAR